ncbi:MAG: hypothetical protein ABIH85_04835, partial [Candidatus Omnitrophota bacterium]
KILRLCLFHLAKKMKALKEKIVNILDGYLGEDYLLFVFGSFAKGKIGEYYKVPIILDTTLFFKLF